MHEDIDVAVLEFVRALPAYVPGRPIASVSHEFGISPEHIVKLASNENPSGMSQRARAALRECCGDVHRYPDSDCDQLRSSLASYLSLEPEYVLPAAGSSEIITLATRAVLRPGRNAIISQYSFISYPLAIRATGAELLVVPARADYGHDLARMAAAVTPETGLVVAVSPNNPTGTASSVSEILAFIEAIPAHVLIVLDEAYRDYRAPELCVDFGSVVRAHRNVLFLRTFSKVHGLAGLRVGYGIAHTALVDSLRRLQSPFSVNSVAQAVAVASLEDHSFIRHSVALNSSERQRLQTRLREMGLRCLPSEGNFLLVHVGDGQGTHRALLRRGVIARPVANYGLPEWLRVTIGLPAENDRFTEVLADAMSCI